MLGDFRMRRVTSPGIGLIGRQQPVMEGAEGRLAERPAAAERLRQGRVSDQPAPAISARVFRELPHQLAAIFLAEEIAVAAKRPVKRRAPWRDASRMRVPL